MAEKHVERRLAAILVADVAGYSRLPWQRIVRRGLARLTAGLVIASGYVMARTGDTGWPAAAITAAAVLLMLATRFNRLWILAAAGVAGGLGLL